MRPCTPVKAVRALLWLGLIGLASGCGGGRATAPEETDGSYQPAGDPVVAVVELPDQTPLEFVWIGPGYFWMGSPEEEPGRDATEGPRHRVTLSRGVYIGRYELTQRQWEAVMNTRPWAGREYVVEHPDHPAVYISWNDVQRLVARLNESGGRRFRLPTEAEWEYACRAGARTPWWFGDQEDDLLGHAWYRRSAWDYGFTHAQPVGTMPANPWGLHDLHGNVQEWVGDWFGSYASAQTVDPTGPARGSARVVRGGSVYHDAARTRSASRSGASPDACAYFLGARLAMEE